MTKPGNRLAALCALDPADLADLLSRVPDVVAALRGEGPLAAAEYHNGRYESVPLPATPRTLVEILSRPGPLHAVVASLDRFHLQLVGLAAWHGGALTRHQALTEAGVEHADALDEAADRLVRLLLATRRPHWISLRPGVADVVGLPGPRARWGLAEATSAELAAVLRRLGEQRVPAKKHERLDRVEASLRDPGVVRRLVDAMPRDARNVFMTLLRGGLLPLNDLGVAARPVHGRSLGPALDWLGGHALIGVDLYQRTAVVWSDVAAALRGRLFERWQAAPSTAGPTPLHEPGPALPAALRVLDGLLSAWAADPPASLAAGGLGVRAIRSAAKALGQPPGVIGLLAALANELGLLDEARTPPQLTGRGRAQRVTAPTGHWRPTALVAAWQARAPAERWALLAQAWRDAEQLDESAGLPERLGSPQPVPDGGGPATRAALLDVLAALAPDMGVDAADLAAAVDFAHPGLFRGRAVDGEVAAMRVLGLVPDTGPIGLTRLGRALVGHGAEAVAELLPPPRRDFTVQADHTVVAAPDLAPDVAARLERYAERESAAVLRLSERRIAAALDNGESVEDIVAFLSDHSAVELAQNVAYLVTDVGRRHGRLRVGSATTYLRCEDPALVAQAVAVKAAKLRALAPTVAVSTLSRDKLLAALRARGLMPVAESADGAVLAPPAAAVAAAPLPGLPALRHLAGHDDPGLLDLAKTILDASDEPGGRVILGPWGRIAT